MQELYKKHWELIDKAIELNASFCEQRKEFIHEIGVVPFAMEFATVSLNLGRRTGKSEYIKTRALDHDVVVLPNKKIKERVYGEKKYLFDFLYYRDLKKGVEKEYITIYVEFIEKLNPCLVYEALAKSYQQTFVFLGNILEMK